MPVARLAAAFGATGVFCAAFGAHGLERHAVEGGLRWWAIAVILQLTTTPALLALAFAPRGRARALSTVGLSAGIVLFSGTLYAMALGAPRWLGAVTPLGGVLLATGWIVVAFLPSQRA